MDLVEKVRQVGEHYELNKYKTLNKTIELDARLANERLLATKIRLNQVSSMNDKLMKQLRSLQLDFRQQEKKLLLTETMLRQLINTKESSPASPSPSSLRRGVALQQPHQSSSKDQKGSSRVGRAKGRLSKFGRSQTATVLAAARPPAVAAAGSDCDSHELPIMQRTSIGSLTAGGRQQTAEGDRRPPGMMSQSISRQVNSSSTQTQTAPSRTRTIINDLRQRLNLVGGGSSSKAESGKQLPPPTDNGLPSTVESSATAAIASRLLLDEAAQTQTPLLIGGDGEQALYGCRRRKEVYFERQQTNEESLDLFEQQQDQYIFLDDDHQDGDKLGELQVDTSRRRRSVSLNDILAGSFVHETATGEQIIVSRGWPQPRSNRQRRARSSSSSELRRNRPQVRLRSRLNEIQKRKLLMQFLSKQQQRRRHQPEELARGGTSKAASTSHQVIIESKISDVQSAMRLTAGAASDAAAGRGRRASVLKLNVRRKSPDDDDADDAGMTRKGVEKKLGAANEDEGLAGQKHRRSPMTTKASTVKCRPAARCLLNTTVQYDLPPPSASSFQKPIALGQH